MNMLENVSQFMLEKEYFFRCSQPKTCVVLRNNNNIKKLLKKAINECNKHLFNLIHMHYEIGINWKQKKNYRNCNCVLVLGAPDLLIIF